MSNYIYEEAQKDILYKLTINDNFGSMKNTYGVGLTRGNITPSKIKIKDNIYKDFTIDLTHYPYDPNQGCFILFSYSEENVEDSSTSLTKGYNLIFICDTPEDSILFGSSITVTNILNKNTIELYPYVSMFSQQLCLIFNNEEITSDILGFKDSVTNGIDITLTLNFSLSEFSGSN